MPDGKQAVSCSDDHTLKLWDLASGREVRTLTGHTGRVNAVAVMPNGERAVSASNELKAWELATGRELELDTLTGHSGLVNAMAVTPDGRRALSRAGWETLEVWNLKSGATEATFTCEALATCAAFAGERKIVVGDASGRVHFLSLELDEDS
jgi:WD40 repeat protein